MTTLPVFQHASPWHSIRLLVFNRQLLINTAVSHGMAVNLESKDILASYEAKKYPPPGWEIEAIANASHAIDKLSKALWSTFVAVLVVALLAIIIAYSAGILAPNLPIAVGKVTSAAGGFLAGWATLFALGTPVRSWKGKALPELIHPKIFTALFIPGLLLAFIGQLW